MDTCQLDSFLGKKLEALRIKKNWSIEKLASELGISAHQTRRYEQGVRIAASLLHKLAQLFDTSVNHFFEGFEKKPEPQEKKSGLNVLLIINESNDDLFIRKALEGFPKRLNIYSINDGLQALIFFRNINNKVVTKLHKPDLIFLGLDLPNVRKFEVLKKLKTSPVLQDIPVIIMADDTATKNISPFHHLHSSELIYKPSSFDEWKHQCYKAFNYWADTVTLPR